MSTDETPSSFLNGQKWKLGSFELDVGARELVGEGRRTKLQEKPFQLLMALLESPGEVVTRGDLQQRLPEQ